MRDVGLGVRAPCPHLVRVLSRVLLDRERRPAIRVSFAQHRIDGAPFNLVVARLDLLFLVGLRILGIVGKLVALTLQLLDGRFQLGNRRADIGQLDDIGFRRLGELPQFGQIVRLFLLRRQILGKDGDNAPGQRDVPQFDGHAGRLGKGVDDRKKRIGGQHRRFIGFRINNF